jgi:hypothetical protein
LVATTGAGFGAGVGATTTGSSTLAGRGASEGVMNRATKKPIATQKATVMDREVLVIDVH